MKILAIDSSGMPASVAVCEDGTLAAEYTVNNRKTHSQTLVPMMDEVRNLLGLDLESVDAIAVAGGPGSFTGLRIGSAAAKLALDYAFETLGLNRVFLRVFADNVRAQKSYENAGFMVEGTFRDDVLIDGRAYDMVFMGILKEDWEKRKS